MTQRRQLLHAYTIRHAMDETAICGFTSSCALTVRAASRCPMMGMAQSVCPD